MRRQLLGSLLCAVTALGMVAVPVTAEAQARPVTAPATTRPVPAPPADAWDPAAGPRTIPKPHRGSAPLTQPLVAWTVNIGASSTSLWPTQWSTITATTNQDLGPTPYYLIIVQLASGSGASWAPVAFCGTGTSCSVSVTRASPGINSFNAYVASYSSTVPLPNVQAAAPGNGYWTYDVNWHGIGIGITSDLTTPAVGQEVTITATTGEDVGPSPFWIQIYDVTNGTRLAVCGYGTSCSAKVSPWQAVTRSYSAVVSDNTAAWPPTGTISWSAATYVTWSISGFQLSLTAPAYASGGTSGNVIVTATANIDVGSTPYFIEIFNQGTGALVGVCSYGSVCSVSARVLPGWNSHVAVISTYDDVFLPSTILANSNSVHTNFNALT
ncbi:MAG TPA: hypothetical protein VEO01_12780 [Pseudonocardiaceae bacterium]|nr:hypothetical protein [Pseudonocardiaceae bacterium]